MRIPLDVVIHTPFRDYIAPKYILEAAGFDPQKDGSKQKKAQRRLFQWADWMQYCEFGVAPNWSKK